ncbi:hypothetical protein ACXHXG_00300 [Rhizobium sp. LEGMi198b]|uniref:hypothetical protein n=1 Tax=unclassified Rhizobium TaxID=2613769 RepID=UPI000CDF4D1A|nr:MULTISPECIES: hypothetical protein [Rhizobium]AVA21138.1 hypothetical protein NXC24_CH01479 [Rhizobium sp. NXC24]MDK4739279.1 hypothetical protein [Rhizobium sp. CNPSo 3464]UWU22327.1 hypothetical protein N2601_04975 [Rhizobium tropici]WFU03129.1 hypothetical protein QA648_05000 [Rhizobium sp. CB3171]
MDAPIELDTSHVRLGDRPLIVCDVDDVVLHFFAPFLLFLDGEGHEFLPRSFRLTGNVISKASGEALEEMEVRRLIDAFFEAQEQWQTPLDRVVDTLDGFSKDADVVFLTAMPPQFWAQRRRLLDRLGLSHPLLASLQPKGPIVQALHGTRTLPVAFVDDMAHNLHSVRDHLASCLLINLKPDSIVHRMAPAAAADIPQANDWAQAAPLIRAHIAR